MIRMYDELGAGTGDLIGHVEVRVTREVVSHPREDVAHRSVAAVPQVQHHVLGERAEPVPLGRRVDESAYRLGLGRSQPGEVLDPDVSGGHPPERRS